jgi:hypothetical protein
MPTTISSLAPLPSVMDWFGEPAQGAKPGHEANSRGNAPTIHLEPFEHDLTARLSGF